MGEVLKVQEDTREKSTTAAYAPADSSERVSVEQESHSARRGAASLSPAGLVAMCQVGFKTSFGRRGHRYVTITAITG
jgi:hypothetical protein